MLRQMAWFLHEKRVAKSSARATRRSCAPSHAAALPRSVLSRAGRVTISSLSSSSHAGGIMKWFKYLAGAHS
jgi:hypothetical protein